MTIHDIACPICGKTQKNTQFPQLCHHCGWQFYFFSELPPKIFQEWASQKAIVQIKFREKLKLAEPQIEVLSEHIETIEKRNSELKLEQKSILETQKILAGGIESKTKEVTAFPTIEQLTEMETEFGTQLSTDQFKEMEEEFVSYRGGHWKIDCTLKEDCIVIVYPKTLSPDEMPQLVLGVSSKPFLHILQAEFIYKIRLDDSNKFCDLGKCEISFQHAIPPNYHIVFALFGQKMIKARRFMIHTMPK